MTLDELKAFVTVAEAGGFTRASELLNRSQPAVSRRIDQLELRLGEKLFDRGGRRFGLTDAGRALLPHAEDALAAVQNAVRAVQNSAANTRRAVTLAVVGTIADGYLVEALRKFQSAQDGIDVALHTANSQQVSDLVRRGEAEIGLRYFPDLDTRLESCPLGSERLYVVVPADHSVSASRIDSLKAFSADRWLAFPAARNQPESYRSMLQTLLQAENLPASEITTVDSLTAQKRLVEAGFGIALMPRRNVEDELRSGSLRIVAVASISAMLPVVLIRRHDARDDTAAAALVEMLHEEVPELLDT